MLRMLAFTFQIHRFSRLPLGKYNYSRTEKMIGFTGGFFRVFSLIISWKVLRIRISVFRRQ